jgi:hypothetical protein
MCLDGTLVILTVGKMKLCFGVVLMFEVAVCVKCCGFYVTGSYCPGKCADENVATCVLLGGAKVSGECGQCL